MGLGGRGLTGTPIDILILPAKRVFFIFGVKVSLEDDSSSRRFTFRQGECLVEPPA